MCKLHLFVSLLFSNTKIRIKWAYTLLYDTTNALLLIYMAEFNRKYGHNNEKAHARTSVVSRSAAWTFG
ncbi:hypothetical protein HMPREF1991_01750 [Hoylesella loescheii DSM 19665 = JCM 12249 = ATCC 15930]|uniref:Uncharacterized protein n=1 Tax=Hoylesella loescheii DSM 19665 = JCM 12249 = ATCC 15930 TaxID=1122985 RepID=A0A069QQW4_HOYLO|nr:hypothetical protein HMPREF1991_01750 [Hoylesella loescheii DSM 19665 = JCM 12249 = ATCC 15930]